MEYKAKIDYEDPPLELAVDMDYSVAEIKKGKAKVILIWDELVATMQFFKSNYHGDEEW